MISIPFAERVSELTAIKTGRLDGGSLKLYQNNFAPSPQTVIGDFVECDFDGYADVTIATWGAAFLDDSGNACSIAPNQTFTMSGTVTPNVCYGWYYTTAGGAYVMGEAFDEPMNFATTGNTLVFVPKRTHGAIAPV